MFCPGGCGALCGTASLLWLAPTLPSGLAAVMLSLLVAGCSSLVSASVSDEEGEEEDSRSGM